VENLVIYAPEPGKVVVETHPLAPPAPHNVVIRAVKTLISTGTESICLHQKYEPGTHWDQWVKFPFHLGYSFAGVVEQVGSEVTRFKPGDPVVTDAAHMAFVEVSEDRVLPIPEGVSFEEAAWHSIGRIVQMGPHLARHEFGDAVVVIGLGILGQLLVQHLRLLGVRKLIAIDTASQRLEYAARFGATDCLELPVQEAREAVFELTDGWGADVVYDVTGAWQVLPAALPLLHKYGKLMLLGDSGFPSKQRLTGDLITKGLSVIGVHGSLPPWEPQDKDYWTLPHVEQLFLDLVARGDLHVMELITHRFKPTDAPEVYRLLEERRSEVLGVIFDWETL